MRIILVMMCWLVVGRVEAQTGPPFDPPGANDHIFPAAAVARRYIDFDAKGFLVGGKRTFLVSAGMEYARVPHELWKDRLLRLQRAGFNCIEIYTFWNFHEPREGQFDFSGDHDLEAFLRLVGKMGLYAIVRVGPYYCAEWDNGGYPLWLKFKTGLRVREDNAEFEKYVDRYFDKVLPIVNRQQIHHGGPVVLVQLENEHPKGWGTVMPDGYFVHLRKKALSLGLEVPYFFSGLHHASDPAGEPAPVKPVGIADTAGAHAGGGGLVAGDRDAGSLVPGGDRDAGSLVPAGDRDAASLDDASRPNPWMSTEFWSVWFTGYSSTLKDAREYERRTWKILAHGGNGYNYYMAYGGSNFGYTNNDEDAACYDYGAAVGQAGDLRPIYYSFKRMGWWARSFEDILENSEDATAKWRSVLRLADTAAVRASAAVTLTARQSPAGDLIFLDNSAAAPISVSLTMTNAGMPVMPGGTTPSSEMEMPMGNRLPIGGNLSLAPGEIFPVVHHFVMDPAVTLEWAPVRMLGISKQGNTTTMVIYGGAGSPAELYFSVRGKTAIVRNGLSGNAGIIKNGEGLSVKPGTGAGVGTGDSLAARDRQQVVLQTTFSDGMTPVEYIFRAGGKTWRILAVNSPLADRTWFVESAGKSYVVSGPFYAGDWEAQDGKGKMMTEIPWQERVQHPVWLYGESLAALSLKTKTHGASDDKAGKDAHAPFAKVYAGSRADTAEGMRLSLAPWQFRSGTGPAAPRYDDRDWKYNRQPLQMGADGDLTANAWYRTTFHTDTAGLYTLQIGGADRATAFVDGMPSGTGSIRDGEITFDLSAGQHELAFFMAHDGRDKLAAYLGGMDSVDRKGLFGKAVLQKGGPSIVTLGGWHYLKATADSGAKGTTAAGLPEGLQRNYPARGTAGWQEYTIGQDAFNLKKGFGWFRTVLADPGAGVSQILLNFSSVDENATVYINGRKIGRHDGWNQPFEVVIGGLDTLLRPLELTLFLENYSNEGGIDKPVRANYTGSGKEITGWRMRGGPGEPAAGDWKMLASHAGADTLDRVTTAKIEIAGKTGSAEKATAIGPRFYRSSFVTPAYGVSGGHPIWRVHTEGLGHGSVWVNGHNLGRYPEKINAPGLYIPECWLITGRNVLVIFDEDGKDPGKVLVETEKAASRDRIVFSNY